MRSQRLSPALLVLVPAFVLAIYLTGAAPGVFWRDSLEFAFLGPQLDIGHPAGSPTFSLLSKAVSFFPLGSLAWRANWLSVCAAVTAFVLMWIATARWLALADLGEPRVVWTFGLAAALSFALSPSFWEWSEVAEVYSLQAAALAALLWLAAEAFQRRDDLRWPAFIGLVLGLSCGVHMAQILYAPAFGLALASMPGRRVSLHTAGSMFVFFLVGFAVFAYLPVRAATAPVYNYGNPATWDAFWAHLTGRKYSAILHTFPWLLIGRNLALLPGHIARELNPLLAPAAVIGLAVLIRRRWRGAMLFLLIVAGHLYLYVKDWSKAFGYIPIYLLAAVLGAVGLAWLWQGVRRQWPMSEEKAAVVPAMLVLLMAAWGLGLNWEKCDRRAHDLAQRHGEAILASLPVNAILVGMQDHLAYNVFYQQLIERQRPDVRFVHRAWLAYPEELARRFPEWESAEHDPETPLAAQRPLLANDRGGGVYWDYGWEERAWVEPSHLTPHGLVFRLRPEAWDGASPLADHELWRDRFWPIATSPLVAPRGYDWTAQEVYARAFHLRAKLHADAERWASAEAEEKTALSLRPDFAETHAFLGLIYLAQRRDAEAASALDRAIELDPYCGLCRAARGRLLQSTRPADALQEFDRAVRLRAADVDVLATIAQLQLQSRRPRPALAALAQIRMETLGKRQAATVETLYAVAFQQQGDCPRAAEHLRRLQALAPDHPAIREVGAACGLPWNQ